MESLAASRLPGSDSRLVRGPLHRDASLVRVVAQAVPNNREAFRREADKAKSSRREQRRREDELARQRLADRRERRRREEAKEQDARKRRRAERQAAREARRASLGGVLRKDSTPGLPLAVAIASGMAVVKQATDAWDRTVTSSSQDSKPAKAREDAQLLGAVGADSPSSQDVNKNLEEWGSTVSASAKQQYEESSRRGSDALRNLGEWGRGVRDSLLGSIDEAAEGVDTTIKKLGETVAKAAPPPQRSPQAAVAGVGAGSGGPTNWQAATQGSGGGAGLGKGDQSSGTARPWFEVPGFSRGPANPSAQGAGSNAPVNKGAVGAQPASTQGSGQRKAWWDGSGARQQSNPKPAAAVKGPGGSSTEASGGAQEGARVKKAWWSRSEDRAKAQASGPTPKPAGQRKAWWERPGSEEARAKPRLQPALAFAGGPAMPLTSADVEIVKYEVQRTKPWWDRRSVQQQSKGKRAWWERPGSQEARAKPRLDPATALSTGPVKISAPLTSADVNITKYEVQRTKPWWDRRGAQQESAPQRKRAWWERPGSEEARAKPRLDPATALSTGPAQAASTALTSADVEIVKYEVKRTKPWWDRRGAQQKSAPQKKKAWWERPGSEEARAKPKLVPAYAVASASAAKAEPAAAKEEPPTKYEVRKTKPWWERRGASSTAPKVGETVDMPPKTAEPALAAGRRTDDKAKTRGASIGPGGVSIYGAGGSLGSEQDRKKKAELAASRVAGAAVGGGTGAGGLGGGGGGGAGGGRGDGSAPGGDDGVGKGAPWYVFAALVGAAAAWVAYDARLPERVAVFARRGLVQRVSLGAVLAAVLVGASQRPPLSAAAAVGAAATWLFRQSTADGTNDGGGPADATPAPGLRKPSSSFGFQG